MSNGTLVLIVPCASLRQAQLELSHYQARQNPTLSNAEHMYSDYASAHSDIPKTVLTKNIDTILAKKIKRVASSFDTVTIDETATASAPASTLSGTRAVSKSSIKLSVHHTVSLFANVSVQYRGTTIPQYLLYTIWTTWTTLV